MDIKTLRKQAGLTQAEAASLAHRTRDTWAAYESGKVTPDRAVIELFEIKTATLRAARGLLSL